MRPPVYRTTVLAAGIAALTAAAPRPAAAQAPTRVRAVPAADFLDSIGVNSSVSRRGETLDQTIRAAQYLGIRWIRAGYEGDIPVADLIALHQQAGVRFSYGLGSGGTDITRLIEGGRQLAAAGALLAFEGPNEPNNWGITYQGHSGGRDGTWAPVASLQRDLYRAVKADAALRAYPVWTISEPGAESDNVGLQFLTVPPGARTTMPAGTVYADFANLHNYVYHPNAPGLADNKTWDAADPTPACRVDGLFGEYGLTWRRHYAGYSLSDLRTLPRVTTETGAAIGGDITEEVHALNLLTLFLDQFKRGFSYTALYLLRDRSDEAGNQQFGFYKPDYTPRRAALYLHNLTTLLADRRRPEGPARLGYAIPGQPATVHDLLLEKSSGELDVVVWDERVSGQDAVTLQFAKPVTLAVVYDPTIGNTPTAVHSAIRSLALTLSNHPVVIAIRRRQGIVAQGR